MLIMSDTEYGRTNGWDREPTLKSSSKVLTIRVKGIPSRLRIDKRAKPLC